MMILDDDVGCEIMIVIVVMLDVDIGCGIVIVICNCGEASCVIKRCSAICNYDVMRMRDGDV